jgi:hypothetical protein
MILVDEKTRLPLKLGQQVKTFRGTVGRLVGMSIPTREWSTGRVVLQVNGHENAYLPGIIGAKWITTGPMPSAED